MPSLGGEDALGGGEDGVYSLGGEDGMSSLGGEDVGVA